MSQPQPESVSPEFAFRAAVTRAQRTTEALIVVEAQTLELAHLLELERERTGLLREQLERYRDAPDTAPADPEGGGDDGPNEGRDDPASVGEAVPTHPFSD